jgi:hypothetical protein
MPRVKALLAPGSNYNLNFGEMAEWSTNRQDSRFGRAKRARRARGRMPRVKALLAPGSNYNLNFGEMAEWSKALPC